MPEPDQQNREQKAAEALIAFSLSHVDADNYSDEEILASADALPLSEEARTLLQRMGGSPFAQPTPDVNQSAEVSAFELAGMYRSGSDDTLDEAVKQEIERKRKELLERLKSKKRKDV
jgi:hypothetical protein